MTRREPGSAAEVSAVTQAKPPKLAAQGLARLSIHEEATTAPSEVGQHDGQCYFSMGFVEAQSLSHRRAEGPFPPREAAELMAKVAEAIE